MSAKRKHTNLLLVFLALLTIGGLVSLASILGRSPSAMTIASAAPMQPADGVEPLPPGASIETLLPNMNYPIAMAFDPAGRLFYTEKTSGNVRLFANGVLQTNPVIAFSVNSSSERGLLGIDIDPDFDQNHYIYVYYTCAQGSSGCPVLENRVVRFVENNGVGSNPTVIFSSPQTAGNHNGGNIHFGPDGKLYISVGDNANAANSQDVTTKNGKMHRLNPDGTIPNDNPVFTQTGALGSLYAIGLRNSFDFTFDSIVTNRIFASENGPGCDDEMNRVEAGWNYGWRASYPCDDPNPSRQYNTIPPLWYLGNGACCLAPTGIEVYTGHQVSQWQNHLFMASYNDSSLRHFYLNGDRTLATTTNVVQGVSVGTDIETGPDGALWYIQGGGYSIGTLKRVVGPGGEPTATPSPTPMASATPTPGCTISFSDVSPSDYFYEAVRYLYCAGVISGYGDGTFRPYNNATRGQICKIIVLAEGWPIDTEGGPHFSDVPADHTFYDYVETAYNRAVISGYNDGTFRPDNNITRAQLSKIIVLAEGWPIDTEGGPHFSDVPVDHPFYGYVETAYNHTIISGYDDGTFRPDNNATRGQISKIVYSAITGAPRR